MRINIEIDGEGQRSATAEASGEAQTGPAPRVLGAASTAAGATDAGPAPTSVPTGEAPPATISSAAAPEGGPGDINAGGPAVPGMEDDPPSVTVEEEDA
jgi:hypothetical protein